MKAIRNPCTRCGGCCRSELCGLAGMFIPGDPPCRALESDGERFACGLMIHPGRYIDVGTKAAWKDEFLGALFSKLLGRGKGCCSATGLPLAEARDVLALVRN